ncbi:LAFA_0D09560g1_1 [Lachancea sp. 'fantastica']|nr:LAFA_0D09560g1_1 [Lachancea sp. 'fantastica']
MGIADDCFRFLIENDSLQTDQIHELLTKIKTHVIHEGILPTNLDAIIKYLCETRSISISTRILLIKDALIPNGKVPNSTVHVTLRHLGIRSLSTLNKTETPKALQAELCKWLIHAYIYMEDVTIFERTYSHWLQLWQLDYLQQWITYILFWSTSKRFVKPWRMRFITTVAENSGYSNARACSTLLLEKFYCLVPSDQIYGAIERLKCNKRRLNTLKVQIWDTEFISNWASIVEHSGGASKFIFQSLAQELEKQLISDSQQEIHLGKKKSSRKISVEKVGTLERLAAVFENLAIPKDLDELFNIGDESSLVFLATVDPHHNLWNRVSEWFMLKIDAASIHGVTASYRHLIFRPLLVASLLNQQHCKIRHLSKASFGELIMQIVDTSDCCCLEAPKELRSAPNFEIGRFYYSCRKLLFQTLVMAEKQEVKLDTITDIEFIVSCITEDLTKHISSRHLTTTLRLLVIALRELAGSNIDNRILSLFLLPQKALDTMMISSDPVMLNTVCSYFILTKDLVDTLLNEKRMIGAQNKNVFDLINYLWHIKPGCDLPMFKVPKKFIQCFLSKPSSDQSNAEVDVTFGILSIPALAFPSRVALRGLEDALTSRVRFDKTLSESSFSVFKQAHAGDWLDTISSFHELMLMILGKLRYHDAYGDIARFLYTHMRNIADNGVS